MPGGFGKRGIEGMLKAIRYARENKIPYFGICLGMQTACIEFARNVCGLAEANSSEFDPATPHRVIYKLRELRGVEELGGTMRLGAWPCKIEPGTLAYKIYGQAEISERHRHRYEFNREYEEHSDRRRACASPDRRPTAPTSRWSNCPIIRISSDASSIPNSNRSRSSRTRCSRHLWAPLTNTGSKRRSARVGRSRNVPSARESGEKIILDPQERTEAYKIAEGLCSCSLVSFVV